MSFLELLRPLLSNENLFEPYISQENDQIIPEYQIKQDSTHLTHWMSVLSLPIQLLQKILKLKATMIYSILN